MKNAYGLLIALALGAAGAMLNWSYLFRKAREVEMVYFVGVKDDVVLEQGDTFRRDDLIQVPVPKNAVGALINYAVLWEDVNTVAGMPVIRRYREGELVLLQDQRTPPPAPRPLNDNERVIGVPVDTRTFVPSLHKPGDFVSFLLPNSTGRIPSPGGNGPDSPENAAETTDLIGPFEIHTVGSRAASAEVSRAASRSATQENVLRIVVKTDPSGELEEKAEKLTESLLTTTFRNVMVIAHPEPGS